MPENEELNCREIIPSEEYMDFIVRHSGSMAQLENDTSLVCPQLVNDKYLIIHVSAADVPDLDRFSVAYSYIPKCYGLLDTANLENIGVLRLRRQPYINLYGSGVLIGFIDTGIDYTHPAFLNSDNKTRIVNIWDQSIQTGSVPEGFFYGSEYTAAQINQALASENPLDIVPSVDTLGHGTFMAGVAAGREIYSAEFSGIAPRSDIAVVKLKQAKNYLRDYFFIGGDVPCYQETDILMAIQYLRALALRRNQPMVLCLGIGTNSGDHNGVSVVDDVLADLSRAYGRAIAVAAGNEANLGHHYRGGPIEGEYEEVELRVAENEPGFFMEFWATAPNVFSVSLQAPGGESIARVSPRINQTQRVTFLFEPTVVFIEYRLLDPRSGDQVIVLRFQDPTPGIWRLRVYDEVKIGGIFDIWLPMEGFIEPDSRFLRPDPEVTVCEPGNSSWVITTSTYNHVNNSIYLNSSRGFARDGAVTPDIAAPGVNVFGPVPGGGYALRTGSSIAAAHSAGAAALILEWGPVKGNYTYMDSTEIKKLLIRGAERDPALTYPNREWGYGRLNVFESFNSIRTAG